PITAVEITPELFFVLASGGSSFQLLTRGPGQRWEDTRFQKLSVEKQKILGPPKKNTVAASGQIVFDQNFLNLGKLEVTVAASNGRLYQGYLTTGSFESAWTELEPDPSMAPYSHPRYTALAGVTFVVDGNGVLWAGQWRDIGGGYSALEWQRMSDPKQ